MENKEFDDSNTFSNVSKKDRITYAQHWILLIRRASALRIDGDRQAYITAVKMLVSSLLSKERQRVRDIIASEYGDISRAPAYELVPVYDTILEIVIDELERKGYLTRETVVGIGVADV